MNRTTGKFESFNIQNAKKLVGKTDDCQSSNQFLIQELIH